MKIVTKYNIGDVIWTSLCDEPMNCIVEAIKCYSSRIVTGRITYYIVPNDGSTYGFNVDESEIFKTKEELIKYIQNGYKN